MLAIHVSNIFIYRKVNECESTAIESNTKWIHEFNSIIDSNFIYKFKKKKKKLKNTSANKKASSFLNQKLRF